VSLEPARDLVMDKVISIKTTRYSELFKLMFAEYADNVQITIDGKTYDSADISCLLGSWCTNALILKTQNFTLSRGSEKLFGFHDHPDELWAAHSQLSFVQRLHADHLIRYEICEWQESLSSRLKKWIKNRFAG
jgi:hypothetical protein